MKLEDTALRKHFLFNNKFLTCFPALSVVVITGISHTKDDDEEEGKRNYFDFPFCLTQNQRESSELRTSMIRR
jgi:hypothetical protein